MTDFLLLLLNASVVVFAVSSMLSVGFGHTFRQVLQPLRNVGAVLRALLANFVLVPLLAFLVLIALPLADPHAIGIFLISTAAGAPFLVKLTEVAATNVALGAALLVLLLPATIVYMPIIVPIALPNAHVSPAAIAGPLLLTMLLPLLAGLLLRRRAEAWAMRFRPYMVTLSTAALVLLVAATVLLNLAGILAILFTSAILAVVLVTGGAFVIGYALGSPGREAREVLGLGTGQRNIAAATVVATQAIEDPQAVVMVVVASLVGFGLLFPIAAWMRRRAIAR